MLITSYDSKGIVHNEFIPEGETVNGEFYLGVSHRLLSRNVRVKPDYPVWNELYCDNAPQKAFKVGEFLTKKHIIAHPPYSPGPSPCYYFQP
ncbi:hypothetical protein Trydic_g22926 [Trypoxylus dichotomus]